MLVDALTAFPAAPQEKRRAPAPRPVDGVGAERPAAVLRFTAVRGALWRGRRIVVDPPVPCGGPAGERGTGGPGAGGPGAGQVAASGAGTPPAGGALRAARTAGVG
ncbi:hypothetical protein SAMN05216223_107328 [Actinacidiphila yanglinensis]|uniref:Uncharacterized protein n=1 Tax=Actinacidiphila yanglinensis TaxID=310779 RepID=A0A1H6BYU2_9ACTN|nr:hypothetical protein SAMN05216223_107328 [Actinacidiphila yanglinensis]